MVIERYTRKVLQEIRRWWGSQDGLGEEVSLEGGSCGGENCIF